MSSHDNIEQFLRDLEQASNQFETDVVHAVEAAGIEVVDFATSTTENTVPGIKANEGERYTHPGGWADRSANLAGSHDSDVESSPGVVELTISTNEEYDEALEALDGYSVVEYLNEGGHIRDAVERNLQAVLDERRQV